MLPKKIIHNCLVHDCVNKEDQGKGQDIYIGGVRHWVCLPCWDFIIKAEGTGSQIDRNALSKDSLQYVYQPNKKIRKKDWYDEDGYVYHDIDLDCWFTQGSMRADTLIARECMLDGWEEYTKYVPLKERCLKDATISELVKALSNRINNE